MLSLEVDLIRLHSSRIESPIETAECLSLGSSPPWYSFLSKGRLAWYCEQETKLIEMGRLRPDYANLSAHGLLFSTTLAIGSQFLTSLFGRN